MAIIIGLVSQKGGVGKSTLCRLLAREFIDGGYSAKIIDLDVGQSTCFEWQLERNKNNVEPEVPVQQYRQLTKALQTDSERFDVLLIDGKPNADKLTFEIAKASDLVIVPTGIGKDDTKPAKRLVEEMIKKGIPEQKISLALCKVIGTAKDTIAKAYMDLLEEGYDVLEGGMRFQAAYTLAFNDGRTATETKYATLNEEAEAIGSCVVERLKKLQHERAA